MNGTRIYLKTDSCVTLLVANYITEQNDSLYQANVKCIDVKLLVEEEEEANVAVNSVDQ